MAGRNGRNSRNGTAGDKLLTNYPYRYKGHKPDRIFLRCLNQFRKQHKAISIEVKLADKLIDAEYDLFIAETIGKIQDLDKGIVHVFAYLCLGISYFELLEKNLATTHFQGLTSKEVRRDIKAIRKASSALLSVLSARKHSLLFNDGIIGVKDIVFDGEHRFSQLRNELIKFDGFLSTFSVEVNKARIKALFGGYISDDPLTEIFNAINIEKIGSTPEEIFRRILLDTILLLIKKVYPEIKKELQMNLLLALTNIFTKFALKKEVEIEDSHIRGSLGRYKS